MPNDERSAIEVLRDSLNNFAETGDGNLLNFPDSIAKRNISEATKAYEKECPKPLSGNDPISVVLTFCHVPGSKNSKEGNFSLSDPTSKGEIFKGKAESMAIFLIGPNLPLTEGGGNTNESPTKEEGGDEEGITEQDIADTIPPPAEE